MSLARLLLGMVMVGILVIILNEWRVSITVHVHGAPEGETVVQRTEPGLR